MLAPIAINEANKPEAFRFIDAGYRQSSQSIRCPLCRKKYLVLLDKEAYRRDSVMGKALQTGALDYFMQRLKESHAAGHWEEHLVMEDTLQDFSSSLDTAPSHNAPLLGSRVVSLR